MDVMRGDNAIVGSKRIVSRAASTIIEDPAERAGPSSLLGDRSKSLKKRPGPCGAMSQQRSDTGSQSTPQKFVRLVGCHDPRIKPQPKR
jgi:hypothetical protein